MVGGRRSGSPPGSRAWPPPLLHSGAPSNVAIPKMANVGFREALKGDNSRLMGVTLLGFTATFVAVSFIGPVITAFTRIERVGSVAYRLLSVLAAFSVCLRAPR